MKLRFVLFVIVLLALVVPAPARADGIIIPEPPICDPCPPPPCPWPGICPPPSPIVQLAIRYHKVDVTIENQVAITHVDQVFHNPNDWPVEGTYLFPLPAGAAVTNFTLWVDGQPVEGQVLDAEQARRTYHEIVSSLRDPALLEYAGRGAVQAHIFPIPAGGERRVELEYTQALTAEEGLVRYVYPLSTEKFSTWPLEKVSVSVDVRSSTPIRAVYSPSHTVATSRESDHHVRAGYEDENVLPDADFALYYSVGESEAFHLMSYRDPEDEDSDGFFLLLLAPRPDAAAQPLPKDVLLVLDRSGSMEGEKFQQAQEALRYVLRNLNEDDRFNIIVFSTGLETFARGMRPVSEASEALEYVDSLSAQGSTDINRALLEAAALADGERPTYLIFLTDGLPTEGVTDSQDILNNLAVSARDNLRLFSFGVGYDVDTFLLDSLSAEHHGASTYVLPGERLDEVLSAFYAKISTPVLTGLELDFGSLPVYDLYPSPLPDLFSGSQIVLVGRYRQGGETDVTLRGVVNGQVQTFTFPGQVLSRDASRAVQEMPALAAIPRLWATRKIGYLLNQVRLNGPDPETVDQIVRLSIRYGIVTPYTSYLVTEDMPLGAEEQERIVQDAMGEMTIQATAPAYGQAAVEKAAGQGNLAAAEAPAAPAAAGSEAAGRVKVAGARTFVLQDETWVDTAFDPGSMQPVQVAFLSDDYFALAAADPALAAAFALGPQVIALSGGQAYQVVAEDSDVPAVEIPADEATPLPPTAPVGDQPGDDQPGHQPGDPTAPVQPVSQAQPGEESPAGARGPCAAGLLPLALLGAFLLARRVRPM